MKNRLTKLNRARKSSIPMRSRWALSVATAVVLTSLGAGAAEYGQYTNEELVQMRGQARDMSEQDRTQYRDEMRSRSQNMSAEERQNLGLGRDRNRADGATDVNGDRRMRNNADNGYGRGEMTRERSRADAGTSGFGSGYEQRQGRGGGGGGMSGRGGGGGRGR